MSPEEKAILEDVKNALKNAKTPQELEAAKSMLEIAKLAVVVRITDEFLKSCRK